MNDIARPNIIDPITLEVLRNALESIADEMGAVLKRTSFSPNIKERMDASCAIFDAEAQLVAQAEHVPVHLGSMLRAVSATVAAVGGTEEGRGDLNAQLAALRIGEQRLQELCGRYGADLVTAGFDAILDYAERRMRRRLAEFPAGTYRAEDFMDDDGHSDAPVRVNVAVTVSPERLVLDYSGSS